MKFKIGDIVCIKSMSDIGKIIDSKGCVGGLPFRVAMNNYCSSRMTIDQIDDINGYYRMKEDPWHFYNDEMIEGLVEPIDCKKCGLTYMSTRCLFMDNCPHNKQKNIMEEETKIGTALNPIEPKSNTNCLTQESIDKLMEDEILIERVDDSGLPFNE